MIHSVILSYITQSETEIGLSVVTPQPQTQPEVPLSVSQYTGLVGAHVLLGAGCHDWKDSLNISRPLPPTRCEAEE